MIEFFNEDKRRTIFIYILFGSLLYALSGMFYMPSINSYKTFYYFLCLTPGILALFSSGNYVLRKNYFLILLIVYLEWLALSILWSDTEDTYSRYLKYTVYISAFVFINIILYSLNEKLFKNAYLYASIFVSIAATYIVYELVNDGRFLTSYRLIASNILFNPLYVASAFGYFFIYTLSMVFLRQIKPLLGACICLPILLVLIQTNTRTPFLAIAISISFFIIFTSRSLKECMLRVLTLSLATGCAFFIFSEFFMQRGSSHRIEVWAAAVNLILNKPFFGHGLEHSLVIWVPGLSFALSDTHNIFLEILYYSGFIGLALFLFLLSLLGGYAVRFRYVPEVVVASTLVIYGLSSGLTEGAGILSRPGVFWFKFWFPISFLLAVITSLQYNHEQKKHKDFKSCAH